MKIGILGSGVVAQTLGEGFLKHGYEVMLGTRNPQKLNEWNSNKGKAAVIGTFEESAKFGELIVLAVSGKAAEIVLELSGATNLVGKTVIDAANPIAELPPVNGVLQYFTEQNSSLMEVLQNKFVESNFVKAFNSIGSGFMVNPDFAGVKPTMFIAGNSDKAKAEVKVILDIFGWESEDMGMVESARPIEALCMLWCIPGFRENKWAHAFKLLKK